VVAGDTEAALALLDEGVALVNDAGGVYHAARNVVRGADHVLRFYEGLLKKVGAPDEVRPRTFNGLAAVEMLYRSPTARYAPRVVLALSVEAGRIAHVYMVLAPRKLARCLASDWND